jgi:hypothetical protein
MQDMDGERIQKTHQLLLWEKKTHKVMDCVHVTKTRDHVTQRHERIGKRQFMKIWQTKMCQLKFMHITEIFLLASL